MRMEFTYQTGPYAGKYRYSHVRVEFTRTLKLESRQYVGYSHVRMELTTMIVRTIKLKLNATQEQTLNNWLWHLTGVYNWSIKKIESNAQNRIYFSQFDFINLLANHSKRMEIPSHVMQGTMMQAYTAWQRCFKKLAKKPKLKSDRKNRKLASIPFPDSIQPPANNRIKVVGLGSIKYHKQDLPAAKIKCGRILKKASGWYMCLWFDTDNVFPTKQTDVAVGMDPGFEHLLTLSDGTVIDNPRELRNSAERLAQAQRGGNKKLVARLHEKQANQRKDRNHKISRTLVENYNKIYYSDDNLKAIATQFGKSVSEASLGGLIQGLIYKGKTNGRTVQAVNSANTTRTCSACKALTGPTGLAGLSVRNWVCSACGSTWDRDYNSSLNILNAGLEIENELHHA